MGIKGPAEERGEERKGRHVCLAFVVKSGQLQRRRRVLFSNTVCYLQKEEKIEEAPGS